MTRRNVIFISIGVLFLLGLSGFFLYKKFYTKQSNITYFQYSPQEINSLSKIPASTNIITVDKIAVIDQIVYQLVRENELGDAYAARVFAYLYTAQRDAAFLSWQTTGQFKGDLNLISSKILCLFFQKNCINGKMKEISSPDDLFSQQIAEIVFSRYQQRYVNEQAQTHFLPEKKGDLFWAGTKPYYGLEVGSWTPWRLTSVKETVAIPPPPPQDIQFWQNQLMLTKNALAHITNDQTKKVVYWAGGPGTLTPPGIWIQIAKDYMYKHHVPIEKQLLANSVLAMGLTDACIAVFNSKYTYWIKRPNMLDTTIITIMPTPNHPSYPAGHSTISGAAAEILSYYFPGNQKNWWELANDAANSRVWGGIHFTNDNQEGMKLGQEVGHIAITRHE